MTLLQDLSLPRLPLARYRLFFTVTDTVRLPDYAGSAWRGVFGRRLKRLVCVTREPACERCLLYRSCVYPYVFETPPDPNVGKLRRYTAAPHPFVLCPGSEMRGVLAAGESRQLELVLFGNGNRYLPYLIHALDQAGQQGIAHGRMRLERVAQASDGDWREIYRPGAELKAEPPAIPTLPSCPPGLTLTLQTPLRIKADGRYMAPDRFRFGALFGNLLRRISMLSAFHTDTPLETDFAGLSRSARDIEAAETRLRWHDWTRYSGRQDTLMQMGGLLGSMRLAGDGLAPFWPYLWLGQWTHAGKGTSMGLGRYRIEML